MFASAPIIDSARKIARIEVDAEWRTGDGRLPIVILQTPRSSVDEIKADASRPSMLAVLNDLLIGAAGKHTHPVLRDFSPGGAGSLVLAPEYALGFGDWEKVDEIVRASPQPVIVIAGFGATLGKALTDWAQGAGPTKRALSWDEAQTPVAPNRPANYAFCWVHAPGRETLCVLLIKNHLEQSSEACDIAAMQDGMMLLHLRFRDLDLIPMICADLVGPVAQAGSAQARVKDYLAHSPDSRPLLVTGSLLQPKQNINWDLALNQWLNVATAGRQTLVAIANTASGAFEPDEARDQWRSMSGVFAKFSDLAKGQPNLDAVRRLYVQGLSGAVVRETRPCITGGAIAWGPYQPTGDMFVWRAGLLCPIDQDGVVAPVSLTPDIAQTEVSRFAIRYPPQKDWCPRVRSGMEAVASHLESRAHPEAKTLMASLLQGVTPQRPFDPDRLHEASMSEAMRKAIYGLATLLTHADLEWQRKDKESGQLVRAGLFNILVWRDAEKSAGRMLSDVGAWTSGLGEHPDLFILAEGPYGHPPSGPIIAGRRDNFPEAPNSAADLGVAGSLARAEDDFTQPKTLRRAILAPLQDLLGIVVDYDKAAPQDDVQLAALLEKARLDFAGAP